LTAWTGVMPDPTDPQNNIPGLTFRYLLATAISASLSIFLPILLHEGFRIIEEVAVGMSLFLVLLVNFLTARIFVFRSTRAVFPQFARFAGLTAAFRLAEYLSFLAAFRLLKLNYLLALIPVLALSFLLKFSLQRVYVFAPTHQTEREPPS
jgi:putative flippase GtrA